MALPRRSVADGHQAPGPLHQARARVTGDRYRTSAEKKAGRRLGVLSLDHRRPQPAGLHRDPPRRESPNRHRVRRARALDFFAGHGITAKRLQTDNAWTYIHNRSLRDLLAAHGIQHRRIPPRTPKRNGKIERYQQTLAREWAYGQRYRSRRPSRSATHLARALQLHPQPQLAQPATHQPRSERPEAQHLGLGADVETGRAGRRRGLPAELWGPRPSLAALARSWSSTALRPSSGPRCRRRPSRRNAWYLAFSEAGGCSAFSS